MIDRHIHLCKNKPNHEKELQMEKPLLLLNLFTESVQKKDEKAAAQYRKEILALDLDSEAAVIAKYRLGFFTLYQEKKSR